MPNFHYRWEYLVDELNMSLNCLGYRSVRKTHFWEVIMVDQDVNELQAFYEWNETSLKYSNGSTVGRKSCQITSSWRRWNVKCLTYDCAPLTSIDHNVTKLKLP